MAPTDADGVRLQKFLADAGRCSRRAGERLILAGRVTVNRQPVTQLGTRVRPGVDQVAVDGKPVQADDKLVYIALNKPVGLVSSCRHRGEPVVLDIVDVAQRVYPVGRLDKDSEGLMLLTNDGRIHHRLLHPSFDHEKEYEVVTARPMAKPALDMLAAGVALDGRQTRPARVSRMGPNRFRMVLQEGRNRQIRRMVQGAGNRVVGLKRLRIANIRLGSLASGRWRHLSDTERNGLLRLLDLKNRKKSNENQPKGP
jgi:pseudouridine synthase